MYLIANRLGRSDLFSLIRINMISMGGERYRYVRRIFETNVLEYIGN